MSVTKEQLSEKSIHLFCELYKITNDQGEKLDFRNHPFLWDIYKDFTPTQAILKAAQIGFSTAANIKALWLAKNREMDIIYSLPTAADVKEFVGGKTNRLIANNPIFQEWTADKDSIESKRVGKNQIYYRGTWTERAAIAIPADLYISDETDRSKQDVVQQYTSRLQHSKHGWRWYFSNPSAPGVGVDKHWMESDQKHWFVKCSGCLEEQFLTMENIKGTPPIFACVKCGKELDRTIGRWRKKWKDKEISGYWISLLMAPWVSAQQILDKKKEYTEEQFTNFVLGLPFVGRGNILTKNLLFQNLIDEVNPQDARPIIGVDTGETIWYTIGNKYGIYFYGQCQDYSELEKLMIRYPKAIMVIDQGGDIIGPRKLREKYQGRVFLCYFTGPRNNDQLVKWDDADGSVTVDRDRMIQLVVDEFTEQRIPLWGKESEWHDFWLHWARLYRTQVENSLGVMRYHWEKASTPCDYPFATVYWRIGMDRFMEQMSEIVMPGSGFAEQSYEENNGRAFIPKLTQP
jgi:hypothetical protein